MALVVLLFVRIFVVLCALTREGFTNECYMWHGSRSDGVDIIVEEGFDTRVAALTGMLLLYRRLMYL